MAKQPIPADIRDRAYARLRRRRAVAVTAPFLALAVVAAAEFLAPANRNSLTVQLAFAIALGGLITAGFQASRRISAMFPDDEADMPGDPIPLSRAEKLFRLEALIAGGFVLALGRAVPACWWGGIALLAAYILLRFAAVDPAPAGTAEAPGHHPHAARNAYADSLTGLLAALLMIVLSYTYLLEAFRIPTGSMEPTLYGHTALGDRALVNKISYRIGEPERGDIAVFRFPGKRSDPYVKRIAGLPGETVLIAQGDLWVSAPGDLAPHLNRPESAVRESAWLPLIAFDGGDATFRRKFMGEKGKARAADKTITLETATEPAQLRFPREGSITNSCPTEKPRADGLAYDTESVGDARVRFTADMPASASLTVKLTRGLGHAAFILKDSLWHLEITHNAGDPKAIVQSLPAEPRKLDTPLSALTFAVANGAIDISVNNAPSERFTFITELDEFFARRAAEHKSNDASDDAVMADLIRALPDRNDCHLTFEATGGAVKLTNLSIDRDLHYLGRTPFGAFGDTSVLQPVRAPTLPYAHRIEPNCFFMLGDHSEDSEDSRRWVNVTVETADGSYAAPLGDFLGLRGDADAARKRFNWYGRISNCLFRIPADPLKNVPEPDKLPAIERDLTDAARGGDFGQSIEFADIYGIPRKIAYTAVKSLKIAHSPEVPRELMDGQLLGSVFPVPRLVN
jgi:signal peptidase I